MSYLNEDGLARYDGLLKNWVTFKSGTVDGIEPLLNWQKTETAGTVAFSPLPAAPIDPVINFLFTETGPASGTKGPDNPSTISGISSVKVTRCGKNLLTKTPMASTMPQRGITVTYNADGSIHLSGTASSSSLPYLRFFTVEPGIVPSILTAGTTLTVSLTCSDSRVYCALYDSDSPTLWGDATIIYPGTPVTHTMSANVKTANLSMVVTRGAVIDCDVYCQIEYGQTATEWEAPADADYTVNLGGTYYGGSVNLSTGTMTMTYASYTFDGNTGFSSSAGVGEYTNFYRLAIYPSPSRSTGNIAAQCACDVFSVASSNSGSDNIIRLGQSSSKIEVDLQKSLLNLGDGENFNTVKAAFNSFFTSHPATVVYIVATPQTVSLTPTQIYSLSQPDPYVPRTNTVYSDQTSVQVGYPKSPLATSTELTNAIVSLGGNI